jgi:hypothetical protein
MTEPDGDVTDLSQEQIDALTDEERDALNDVDAESDEDLNTDPDDEPDEADALGPARRGDLRSPERPFPTLHPHGRAPGRTED